MTTAPVFTQTIYLDLCCFNRPFDDQRQTRVQKYAIAYDALGRITTFTQLPSATVGTGTTSISLAGKQASFTYDANGNRLSSIQITGTGTGAVTTSRSYLVQASGNRLLGFSQSITAGTATGSTANVAHTYDANGSLISDGLRTYEYDAGNRLAAATLGTTDASPNTRYVHNALGQRLFKTEPQFPPAPGDENDPTFMASLIAFFTQLWGQRPQPMRNWASRITTTNLDHSSMRLAVVGQRVRGIRSTCTCRRRVGRCQLLWSPQTSITPCMRIT